MHSYTTQEANNFAHLNCYLMQKMFCLLLLCDISQNCEVFLNIDKKIKLNDSWLCFQTQDFFVTKWCQVQPKLESVWKMFGWYLEGVLEVYESCFEGVCDRSSGDISILDR